MCFHWMGSCDVMLMLTNAIPYTLEHFYRIKCKSLSNKSLLMEINIIIVAMRWNYLLEFEILNFRYLAKPFIWFKSIARFLCRDIINRILIILRTPVCYVQICQRDGVKFWKDQNSTPKTPKYHLYSFDVVNRFTAISHKLNGWMKSMRFLLNT